MSRPVATALLDLLRDWGIRHVFTCPGSTEAAVLDALVDRSDIELVLTTHESVTVSMADGLARVTGEPTVAYLHANVGLTNGLANLYAAQLAHSPVLVLNGLKPASIQSRAGFTTARRMRDLVGQFVKDDWQSLTADAVVEDVHRALTLAVAEPAGPAWVGLGQDLLEQVTDAGAPDVPAYRFDSRVRPPAPALAAAAEILGGARAPVLVAGTEVGRAGALAELVALAERLGAPVLMEERRGFERPGFPVDHPHFRGHYSPGHPLVQQADVLFFAGARVFHEFEPAKAPPLPAGARVIHSHPDPRQIARIHPVDVGLVGDQALLLAELVERVPTAGGAVPGGRWEPEAIAEPPQPGGFLSPRQAVRTITETLRGSTFVGDATTAGGLLQQYAEQLRADDYFVSTSGSLGWGMGAALGIKLGLPSRQVVAVLGDGVFQFGMPALWTAARYRIPVTFVVLNNQRYAAVGAALRRFGGRAVAAGVYPGTDLAGPCLAEVGAGFGVPSWRVTDEAALKERLAETRTAHGPTLVEVMTDPDDFGP